MKEHLLKISQESGKEIQFSVDSEGFSVYELIGFLTQQINILLQKSPVHSKDVQEAEKKQEKG